MDDLPLVEGMVRHLATNLEVPITVKIRRFDCVQRTVEYAQMLERAGAWLLAIHGRTREQRRASEVLAEWEYIRAVKQVCNGGARRGCCCRCTPYTRELCAAPRARLSAHASWLSAELTVRFGWSPPPRRPCASPCWATATSAPCATATR
jgi:hypothetical protein